MIKKTTRVKYLRKSHNIRIFNIRIIISIQRIVNRKGIKMYIGHILIWSCSLCSIISVHALEEKALVDLKKPFDINAIETQNANFEITENAILVNTAHNERLAWS